MDKDFQNKLNEMENKGLIGVERDNINFLLAIITLMIPVLIIVFSYGFLK